MSAFHAYRNEDTRSIVLDSQLKLGWGRGGEGVAELVSSWISTSRQPHRVTTGREGGKAASVRKKKLKGTKVGNGFLGVLQ